MNGGSVGADSLSSSADASSPERCAESVLPSVISNWWMGFNQRHVAVETSGCKAAGSDFSRGLTETGPIYSESQGKR